LYFYKKRLGLRIVLQFHFPPQNPIPIMSANQLLDTGKKYIKDLFASDCFYNIPDYQRPYVWEKEQIHALLDDVANAFDSGTEKEYFLGCMIWNKRDEEYKTTKYFVQDILDGQQRFITLFLILAVLRDLCPKIEPKIKAALRQEADEYEQIPERDRIVFAIRSDKEFIDKYIIQSKGTNDKTNIANRAKESSSRSVKNMAEGVLAIREWWTNTLKGKPQAEALEYISEFFKYLYNKVLVLFLSTPDSLDDAYNLFTTLNGRGVQLLPSDLLKAQNLRGIADEDTRTELAQKWDILEQQLQNYNGIDRLLWLVIEAKMKYNSDDNKTLKDGFKFLKLSGNQFFGLVFEYSKLYVSIFEEGKSNIYKNLVATIQTTMGESSKIFLALVYYKKHFGDYRIDEFLIKIENLCSLMWMLSRMHSISTRVYNILKQIDECLANSEAAEKEKAADTFLAHPCLSYEYEVPGAKTSTCMELIDFLNELDQNDWGDYNGTKVNKIKYLLIKLDLIHASQDTRFFSSEKSKISLEHILPRNPANNTWTDFSKDVHEKWVHKLGNLILINKNTNSSISNSEYAKKRKEYSGHYENRAYTNYVFMNHSTWTPEELEANHNRAVNLLIKYYEGNSLQAFVELKKSLSK
jgi:uncharacterized protein with ParB-like and HNH nuclease domain